MYYECDPVKNTKCKGRKLCLENRKAKKGSCHLTTHKEFAKTTEQVNVLQPAQTAENAQEKPEGNKDGKKQGA